MSKKDELAKARETKKLIKDMDFTSSWGAEVFCSSEADLRGAIPEAIDPLLEKPPGDIVKLMYKAVDAQVEDLCSKGEADKALEIINALKDTVRTWDAPINVFKRDAQEGNAPYMGAHTIVGGARDAMKFLFEIFCQKKGDGKPASQHFRKYVQVRPHHIFLYRDPELTKRIEEVDGIEGQQPIPPSVKGFAKHEVIHHPYYFKFRLLVNPRGAFQKHLSDAEKVLEALNQASHVGWGSSRGIGYGMFKADRVELISNINWRESIDVAAKGPTLVKPKKAAA